MLEVAARLRYTPHAAARSLSSRRTNTVGVVLPDLYGEFFSELMRGIDGVARNRRQHLLVSSYHGDQEQQGAAPVPCAAASTACWAFAPCREPGLPDRQPAAVVADGVDQHHLPGQTTLSIDDHAGAWR